jgi:hypothetical protein
MSAVRTMDKARAADAGPISRLRRPPAGSPGRERQAASAEGTPVAPVVPVAPATASTAPAEPPRSDSAGLLGDVRFGYRPIWDSKRNAIAAYLCVAQVPISDVVPMQGDAELALSDDTAEMARLDTALQRRVITDLAALTAAGRRLMVTLPVHFDSLGQAAWRRKYLADMAQLDADTRRLAMVEIVGVPPGVLQSRLFDLLTPFRSLCRGVVLRLSPDMKESAQIRGCGAVALACDLTGRAASEKVLDQQMNRLAQIAERTSLPSYLHGAQTRSLVMAAVGAGFNYIDGSALAKLVDHPWHALEFRLTDLYGGTALPAAP